MDIDTLKIFVEVYKCKSITQASKRCFISRQGISSVIARFEDELTCKLFVRSATGVEPTKAGVLLFSYAQRIVEIADEFLFSLENMLKTQNNLDVYVSPGVIQEFAHNPIARFAECYPSVYLSITEAEENICESAILERKAEIALTPAPIDDVIFDAEPLLSVPYVLVVNEAHPLAKNNRLSVIDLKDIPVMVRSRESKIYSNFYQACIRAEFNPSISMHVSDSTLIFHMASIGKGIGITTQTLFERLRSPRIKAITFWEPEMTWSLNIIKRKNAELSVHAKAFWDIVLKYK